MNQFTKTSFIVGIILLVYGYLCRILNIYFFWDSQVLGWIILFLSLAGFLFGVYKSRKAQKKKTIWVKIGIGFLSLGLIILPFVIFMLKTSEAYEAAIEYLKTDSQIKNSVGNIKGFGLIPTGAMQFTITDGVESGDATFDITIRGDKKYKDITVNLQKTPETIWTVISIE